MVQKFIRKRFEMTEKKIAPFFPEINRIPKQFALEGPIMQDQYLVKGELRRWNGPFHEIFSPVCVQSSSGLSPNIIGSYPLLTENESMDALRAARAAFDNGSGSWPSMTAEQRIECFEDFLIGNDDKERRDRETYHVGNRKTLWRFAQRVRPHRDLRPRYHKSFEKG